MTEDIARLKKEFVRAVRRVAFEHLYTREVHHFNVKEMDEIWVKLEHAIRESARPTATG